MLTLIIVCDRCSERCTTDPDRSELTSKAGPMRKKRPRIDICGACAADLDEFLGLGPQPTRRKAEKAARPEASKPAVAPA